MGNTSKMSAISFDQDNLFLTFIGSFGYQMLGFTIAYCKQFDKLTDLAYGSNMAILGAITLGLAQTLHVRQIVVSAMVMAWGVRLAGYLFYRINVMGKDERFDGYRNCLPFFGFWFFQFFVTWIQFMPIAVLNASTSTAPLDWRDYLGFSMWGVGFVIEFVADIQKFRFKRRGGKGWCNVGVWKWSRHPNLYGDILQWWGLFT